VSDGYMNSRVVKFAADGKLTAAWGTKGSRALQFNVPHSVAVDDRDRIYVADRENDRIQVLDADGRFLTEWTDADRPITVRFAGNSLFVLSNLDADRGIVRRLDLNGKVLDSFPTKPTETTEDFEWPHGMAVADGGRDVYVGFTLTGRRVQRYRRKSHDRADQKRGAASRRANGMPSLDASAATSAPGSWCDVFRVPAS
jgi:DNA-binding beta-propeller fold protein YncE